MKKSLRILSLFLLVFSLAPSIGRAQGFTTLKVLSMQGFPDLPADSAYEGQFYTFNVIVTNNTNIIINTNIDIQLKVDSIETTIFSSPQPSVQPGDTVTFSISGYSFTQPQYKAGNNIVVVWPRVNGQVVPIDSFFTDVFFVPLNSLGDGYLDSNDLKFSIFPVPARDLLYFSSNQSQPFEYVRIYSIIGELLLAEPGHGKKHIYVGSFQDLMFLKPLWEGNVITRSLSKSNFLQVFSCSQEVLFVYLARLNFPTICQGWYLFLLP